MAGMSGSYDADVRMINTFDHLNKNDIMCVRFTESFNSFLSVAMGEMLTVFPVNTIALTALCQLF